MEHEEHNPKALDFEAEAENAIQHPHYLGSGLLLSLMCHVLLVAVFAGYDLNLSADAEGSVGNAPTKVAAHLQSAKPFSTGKYVPMPNSASVLENEEAAPNAEPVSAASAPLAVDSPAPPSEMAAYASVDMLSVAPNFQNGEDDLLPPYLGAAESGHIVVQLLINADGGIDQVVVESSSLSAEGTQQFVQHLGSLRLVPGQINGSAVKSRWHLEFTVLPTTNIRVLP